jgi:hypothetical protein
LCLELTRRSGTLACFASRSSPRTGRLATGFGFLVALVVIDVAQGRLSPSLQTVTLTAGLRLPQLELI